MFCNVRKICKYFIMFSLNSAVIIYRSYSGTSIEITIYLDPVNYKVKYDAIIKLLHSYYSYTWSEKLVENTLKLRLNINKMV